MRRARILREPCRGERPFVAPPMEEREEGLAAALGFYRHECADDWFAELLEREGLVGKRLTPSRTRRLILAAIRKEREER